MCVYIYIHTHTHREREREIDTMLPPRPRGLPTVSSHSYAEISHTIVKVYVYR